MDWKIFITSFISYQIGFWICYLNYVKKVKFNFKRKKRKITIMNVKYTQKTRNGLINNHEYIVKIFPPKSGTYVYIVQFIYDVTLQEEMDKVMNYASMISIKHNFDFDDKEWEVEE